MEAIVWPWAVKALCKHQIARLARESLQLFIALGNVDESVKFWKTHMEEYCLHLSGNCLCTDTIWELCEENFDSKLEILKLINVLTAFES